MAKAISLQVTVAAVLDYRSIAEAIIQVPLRTPPELVAQLVTGVIPDVVIEAEATEKKPDAELPF